MNGTRCRTSVSKDVVFVTDKDENSSRKIERKDKISGLQHNRMFVLLIYGDGGGVKDELNNPVTFFFCAHGMAATEISMNPIEFT